MTDRAAIMGSLVDVRNIGVHKSVKLTIHVPEEMAVKVIDAFGWPTGVDPVPVAIARLLPEAQEAPAQNTHAKPALASDPHPARVTRSWRDMPAAAQAAIRCNEVAFQRFLQEQFSGAWKLMNLGTDAERAAEVVRFKCDVQSRKDIRPGTESFDKWNELNDTYQAWMRVAV